MKKIKNLSVKGLLVSTLLSIPMSFGIQAAEIDHNQLHLKNTAQAEQSKKVSDEPAKNKTMSSMPSMVSSKDKKVTTTRDPHANSGGYEYRGMGGWEETDDIVVSKIIFEQLETRKNSDADFNRWDMQGWRGTDYNKLWVKFEGEEAPNNSSGEFEFQALYSKAIAAYWDLQLGARYDRSYGSGPNDERYFGVLGMQGLAPYWFEVESNLFIDTDANVSARVVASYDLLFSQKLILQPRLEINASANDLPNLGIGQGINDFQFDLRLRYELQREIAPYIGVTWQKKYGDSALYSELRGESAEFSEVVAGIRIWF
ncbi:MAG: copper resistance protein B [Enterobacterales bacterium]|nr:copper resistance protein B [Enterobacterales bacterium]